MKLTDEYLRKATPGRHRDEVHGFFADKGSKRTSFFVQYDKYDGRGGRQTIKKRIGIFDQITTAKARSLAKTELENIKHRPQPGRIILQEAWDNYRERHLLREEKRASSIVWYKDQIERALADWCKKPLAELVLGDTLAKQHEAIAARIAAESAAAAKASKRERKILTGRYAANQAMRAFKAVYLFARENDKTLPEMPKVRFFKEKANRKGVSDLTAWWAQLTALPEAKELRRCFHALTLLTGSRPEVLTVARWEYINVGERRWHFPAPKGGEDKAFDVPLSYAMLRWLSRARRAAEIEARSSRTPWVFPSSASASGHMAEQKERRTVLAHWGVELRRTYRSVAEEHATALQIKKLMNHSIKADITDRYDDPRISWPGLVKAQERISAALTMKNGAR